MRKGVSKGSQQPFGVENTHQREYRLRGSRLEVGKKLAYMDKLDREGPLNTPEWRLVGAAGEFHTSCTLSELLD